MARWPNRYSGKGPRNGQDRKARHGKPWRCKAVGEGVSELRIHYGPGYRVYYKQRGSELVILLAGGEKGSQSRDIKIALRLAKSLPDSFLS
jgi:putative addiction module killer protein